MKKIYIRGSILICFCMLLLCTNCIKSQAILSKDKQYTYKKVSKNTVCLTKYKGKETVIKVPAKVDGYKVVAARSIKIDVGGCWKEDCDHDSDHIFKYVWGYSKDSNIKKIKR